MQKYKRDYFAHYGVGEQDVLLCVCGAVSVDLHHVISKGQGGSDHYSNLIPLCRACHERAHTDREFYESLKKLKSLTTNE